MIYTDAQIILQWTTWSEEDVLAWGVQYSLANKDEAYLVLGLLAVSDYILQGNILVYLNALFYSI